MPYKISRRGPKEGNSLENWEPAKMIMTTVKEKVTLLMMVVREL